MAEPRLKILKDTMTTTNNNNNEQTASESIASLTQKSCEVFSDELASKTSVPGGGAAAAYVGALAAGLCSMSGNFTLGKKKYAHVEPCVIGLIDKCEKSRARLLELMDADAQAFQVLAKAYSIPKDDPGRSDALERCTKDAITPPLEMMREVAHTIELLEEMHEVGSRMLISDVGCGAALGVAALQASSLNVFVNTKALKDREFARNIEQEADSLLAYVSRAQCVFDKVNEHLRD